MSKCTPYSPPWSWHPEPDPADELSNLSVRIVELEEQNAYLQRDLADAQRNLVETKKRYEEKLKRAAEVIRLYKVLSFGPRYAAPVCGDCGVPMVPAHHCESCGGVYLAAAYEEAEKRIAAFSENQEG